MRTATLRSIALACIASATLLTTSCNRKDDATPTDDITTAEDRTDDNSETAMSSEAMQMAGPTDPQAQGSANIIGDADFRARFSSCATRSYDFADKTLIIDFGVAKARDRVSQDTSAGQLKGKIRYMAPEQALGRELDRRADVWALGSILYELFAGVSPYDAPNEVATLHKLTSGVGPAPLPAHVPEPVRAVVERSLAYDPQCHLPRVESASRRRWRWSRITPGSSSPSESLPESAPSMPHSQRRMRAMLPAAPAR